MSARPHISAHEDPFSPTLKMRIGGERLSVNLREVAYHPDGVERMMRDVYDAAKRDVRASMSPLDRPGVRTVRVGNRVRLVR